MVNKIYIIIVLSVLVQIGCTHRIKVIDKWDNGNIKKTTQKLQSQYVIETFYYQSGVKESEISLFNNKLDGASKHWDIEGVLISESNFENGELHGATIHYYPEEIPKHSVEYFYGQKHGYDRWYYSNGQIKSEAQYKFGERDSEIIRWDENGYLIY
ncbi:MAG: hypothetical protein ISR90_04750 [Candidatus Marinimicrobia bacterium]|nr:hypothetical protein [Candidatus Neomarinimicrobiota bacterium]MBL7023347.1 hypothetical protein [Candidatus Neomarinimicrobiota bacterium]MBL7109306.1 hypothetical protein [Candidatus Neomarinimicrobiota bacterium]